MPFHCIHGLWVSCPDEANVNLGGINWRLNMSDKTANTYMFQYKTKHKHIDTVEMSVAEYYADIKKRPLDHPDLSLHAQQRRLEHVGSIQGNRGATS
jgi:hypothetical protein